MDIKLELRVGNLIKIPGADPEIATLDQSELVDILNGDMRGDPEGVPLTKDHLIALGFNDKLSIVAVSTYMVLDKQPDGYSGIYAWYFDRYKFVPLSYVHQVQNLYYELTKQQLEYNPERLKQQS